MEHLSLSLVRIMEYQTSTFGSINL
uniref:Uncharacterized protein n=1 Tax=Rhizophora mucronata TaxID=61149 RepID=A0A2P2Q908_RHIMU